MHNCIVNFEDAEVIEALKGLGYACIQTIESNKVSDALKYHADVLYLKIDDSNILISNCQRENKVILEKLGFSVFIVDKLHKGYKTESFLNVVIAKDTIIYNPKTAIDCLNFNDYKYKISVNQGYTKCSTVTIDSNTFLTDDIGIHKKLINVGKDCLLVNKGIAALKGYEYGFIGGSTAMLKDNTLLFFGDILNTEEKQQVIEYLCLHNIKPVFIKNKQLTDIGGAIIL